VSARHLCVCCGAVYVTDDEAPPTDDEPVCWASLGLRPTPYGLSQMPERERDASAHRPGAPCSPC
jgi:hypothetical protein